MVPAPNLKHQKVQFRLGQKLGQFILDHELREFFLVLHPAVPDPRIHETGYRVGAWRWPRGRFLYGAKSPFFSWTRSPASTPYCETGDSSGERAL